MVVLCLICAGLASGLTQGLLSLDFMEMTIKSRSGTPDEKLYASKVLPVIRRHHLLLVTLMLWNASATEGTYNIMLTKVIIFANLLLFKGLYDFANEFREQIFKCHSVVDIIVIIM